MRKDAAVKVVREGDNLTAPRCVIEGLSLTFWCVKRDIDQAIFWRVNVLLMPNDSVFDWCAFVLLH